MGFIFIFVELSREELLPVITGQCPKDDNNASSLQPNSIANETLKADRSLEAAEEQKYGTYDSNCSVRRYFLFC